jgi:hypothetical protein
VAAAAALGSLVVVLRPWRWPAFGATFRSMPGQAGRGLQQLLSNPAIQAAIIGWLATSMRSADKATPSQDTAAAAGTAAPSGPAAGGSSAEMQVP